MINKLPEPLIVDTIRTTTIKVIIDSINEIIEQVNKLTETMRVLEQNASRK